MADHNNISRNNYRHSCKRSLYAKRTSRFAYQPHSWLMVLSQFRRHQHTDRLTRSHRHRGCPTNQLTESISPFSEIKGTPLPKSKAAPPRKTKTETKSSGGNRHYCQRNEKIELPQREFSAHQVPDYIHVVWPPQKNKIGKDTFHDQADCDMMMLDDVDNTTTVSEVSLDESLLFLDASELDDIMADMLLTSDHPQTATREPPMMSTPMNSIPQDRTESSGITATTTTMTTFDDDNNDGSNMDHEATWNPWGMKMIPLDDNGSILANVGAADIASWPSDESYQGKFETESNFNNRFDEEHTSASLQKEKRKFHYRHRRYTEWNNSVNGNSLNSFSIMDVAARDDCEEGNYKSSPSARRDCVMLTDLYQDLEAYHNGNLNRAPASEHISSEQQRDLLPLFRHCNTKCSF